MRYGWPISTGRRQNRVTDYLHGLSYGPRSLAWSPDGKQIALALRLDEVFSIYVLNADGSNFRRVAKGDQLTWSPDSKQLANTTFTQGNWDDTSI